MHTIRKTLHALILCITVGLAATLAAGPASADRNVVCRVELTFRIAGDDLRGNTLVQVTLGTKSFLVSGGIPGNTIDSRIGEFEGCVPNQPALEGGFAITSISNPSWPETTDNWDLAGLTLRDPDTDFIYFDKQARGTRLIHRFTGEEPTIHTGPIHLG
ncbi:hypothetical protein IU459_27680 [Nocardia amamiensis]|uniref:PLAT domain-containing protein n=1 Tax=Nocardia amamiensis TaxID=404578 RepID=A0ABS0CXG7_9NOCA|nr:hypothetical protein [Nocardia amamiensis]MBF6301294.1 hypothetical protein [Nocardia amamiensis]